MEKSLDKDIEILKETVKHYKAISKNLYDTYLGANNEQSENYMKRAMAISNVLSELEKYKNVTYFEKLEDGKLYKIDKERADDLYKHGNGNWLYIQMWKRKEDWKMSDIDKAIKIVKDLTNQMLTENSMWVDYEETGTALENVLSDREFLQDKVNWYSKEYDKLFDENNKLSNELETWKKIAEKLAGLIHKSNAETGCYVERYGLVENCKGMTWCKECIIDWAKREVENEFKRSN